MSVAQPQRSELSAFQLIGGLLLVNVLWAPVNFWVKLASNDGLGGIVLGAARWGTLSILLSLLLLIPAFRRSSNYVEPNGRQRLQAMAIGLLLFGPAHMLYYTSLPMTSATVGTVLLTTAPLWTTLFSMTLLKERAPLVRWLALVLAMVGAYVVSVGWHAPKFEGSSLTGNAMFFTGVILECLGGVLVAGVSRAASGVGALRWQIVGSVPAYGIAILFLRPPMPQIGPNALLALGYLIVLSGVVTFTVYYALTERAPLSLLVLPIGLQPPISAFFGARFLGERLTPNVWQGALIILGALVIGFTLGARSSARRRSAASHRNEEDLSPSPPTGVVP